MRNRLQFSFWGVRVNAEGVFAITAALLIVIVVVTTGIPTTRVVDSFTRFLRVTAPVPSLPPDGQTDRSAYQSSPKAL